MLPMLGWLFRSSAFPRLLRWGVRREAKRSGGTHAEWAAAEYRRLDVRNILCVTGDPARNSIYVFAHNGVLGFPTAKKIQLPKDWDAKLAAAGKRS